MTRCAAACLAALFLALPAVAQEVKEINEQDARMSRSLWWYRSHDNEWHYTISVTLPGPLTGLSGETIIPAGGSMTTWLWLNDDERFQLPLLALLRNDAGASAQVTIHPRRGGYYHIWYEKANGTRVELGSDRAGHESAMSSIFWPRERGRFCFTVRTGDSAQVDGVVASSAWMQTWMLRAAVAQYAKWKAWYSSFGYYYWWNIDQYFWYVALSTPMESYYANVQLGTGTPQSPAYRAYMIDTGATRMSDLRRETRNWQYAGKLTIDSSFNANPGWSWATLYLSVEPSHPEAQRVCYPYLIW